MALRKAHILDEKWRSNDIKIGEDVEFSSLLLPDEILKGLSLAGFKYPSPIQLEAIPVSRMGKDIIVQAKSGTGKTLVFTIAALNVLLKKAKHPQVLITAPTREIACQISQIIKCVGFAYKHLKCDYFIGGRKLDEDIGRIEGCQIVVGTPGRIKQLITLKILKTSGIRLFVLDEGDELLKDSSFMKDIDVIFRALPRDKQMIATSATYPDKLHKIIDKYFRKPVVIQLNKEKIGLLGMVHYYYVIPVNNLPVMAYRLKLKILENVLLNVKFGQCLVFCNMISRVENLCVEIKNMGFATSFISSARNQADRLKSIELLRRFKCKVLVSSDVSSRGIDAEHVDLVINFDIPTFVNTYFHRVGRAGRYGTKCASVSFFTSDEIEIFRRLQINGKFEAYPLPDPIPADLISMQPKGEELLLDVENQFISDLSNDAEDQNKNGGVEETANSFIESINGNYGESTSSFCSNNDAEDVKGNEGARQEKTHSFSEGIELNSQNVESTSHSNSNKDAQDLYENGDVLQETTNGFIQDIEFKGQNELSCTSKVDDLASENLTNMSDKRLADSVLANTKLSNSHGMLDQVFDLNYSSLKDNLSSTSQCVEVELQKSDLPSCIKLNRQKETTEVKVVPAEEENYKLKVNKSSDEKSCVSEKLVERKLDQQNYAMSVRENTKNCHSSNTHGLQQITNTNSCLVDLESDPEKSLKGITINDKSLVMNNECSASKNLNPESKHLVSSVMTFIEEYESYNKDFGNCCVSDSIESSQSLNVKLNDDKVSHVSLMSLKSNLSQYYYNVCKRFAADISEDLSEEMLLECRKVGSVNQVLEIGNQNNVRQNDAEYKIQDSNLESQPPLFSTPKTAETLSGSSHSSDQEASGNDKDKLIEHFNVMLESIQGEPSARTEIETDPKTAPKTEHKSCCEPDSDSSVYSRETMCMLYKELKIAQTGVKSCNKNDKTNIKYNSDSSVEIVSDSCQLGSRRPQFEYYEGDKVADKHLQNKFSKTIKGKRSNAGSSKDAEEVIKCIRDIQSTSKCFRDIIVADTKKHADSSSSTSDSDYEDAVNHAKSSSSSSSSESSDITTSTFSDSDTSTGSKEGNVNLKKEGGKKMQNEIANSGKYPEESDSSSHDEHQRKSCKKGKVLPKTSPGFRTEGKMKKKVEKMMRDGKKEVANMKVSSKSSRYKTKIVNGPTQNKITYYYSESESDVDQNSLESQSSDREGHKKKTVKDEMRPKTDFGYRTKTINGPAQNKITYYYSETENEDDQCSNDSQSSLHAGCQRKRTDKKDEMLPKIEPSKFGINEISNPYLNPSTGRPIFGQPHSSPQIQPSYASDPYNRQHFQQSRNHSNLGACHPSYQMHPSYYASDPYNRQDFQQSQNHANPGACHPSYQMYPSCYASDPYNRQYFQQSQNHANPGTCHPSYQMHPSCYASDPFNSQYSQQSQTMQGACSCYQMEPSYAAAAGPYNEQYSQQSHGQFLDAQYRHQMQSAHYIPYPQSQVYPSEYRLKDSCQMRKKQPGSEPIGHGHSADCSTDNFNSEGSWNPSVNNAQSSYQMQQSHYGYNQCVEPSLHPCHPPNDSCQSPACAAWYDIFNKQWQFHNQSRYF